MTSQKAGDANNFFYFAYGSNLLDERIHLQIKCAKYVSTGLLSDYRLEFYDHGLRWMGAVASVELSKGDEVWGCVWHVPWSFSDELDRQESGYHRLDVNIKVESSMIICRTYQYSNPNRERKLPSPHYKLVIISGAIEHSLPLDYIEKLKAIKDNDYRGSKDSVQTHFLDVLAMHRENHDVNCAVFNYPLNSSFVYSSISKYVVESCVTRTESI